MEFDLSELNQDGLRLCCECDQLICTNCQPGICANCRKPLCDLCYSDAGRFRDNCLDCASSWNSEARKIQQQQGAEDTPADYEGTVHYGVPRKFN